MTSFRSLATRCSTFALLSFSALCQAMASQPNVIIVMTDDQGYPELSAHGNPVLQTPNLDRLHSQSVRLTDYHASPMCTPTRGSLMTGLDPARHGAINVSSGRTLLRKELPTMADLLARAGYRTGIFGKWHLGDNYPYRPEDRGFEETLWFPSSHIGSVPDAWGNNYFGDKYRHNGKLEQFKGYCTDIFFQHAIDWMKKKAAADEPFFTYLPTNTPHGPFYAHEKDIAEMKTALDAAKSKLPKLPPGIETNLVPYLAMIRNVDHNVGRLLKFLDQSGLAENTILVFATDNGSTFGHAYYPAGMRGRKTELWEGGHRVPCFFRWPAGGFGEARDVDGITQTQDVLPTILDLCGVETAGKKFDGISLAPVLRGKKDIPRDRMFVINYSRMPHGLDYPSPDSPSIMRREGAAVLWKRWRLLRDSELYDLESDPLQQANVIDQHPEVVEKMRNHLDTWWKKVADIANEPQRVIIGHRSENPMMLTACEWMDVFVDQQGQVRRGDQKNGYWELEVDRPGQYEFELRRWPREIDLPLSADFEGEGAMPIKQARLFIGGKMHSKAVMPSETHATFTVPLEKGPARLHTWFNQERKSPICGAYYVYVRRLDSRRPPDDPDTRAKAAKANVEARRLAAEHYENLRKQAIRKIDATKALDLVTAILQNSDDDKVKAALMRGMLSGLEGRRDVTAPKGWSKLAAGLAGSGNSDLQKMALQLGQIFGDKEASKGALATLMNRKAKIEERRAALRSLVTQRNAQVGKTLESLLDDPNLRLDAIRAYSVMANPKAPALLLQRYPKFDSEERRAVIETLATREEYAKSLLAALEKKTVARKEVPTYVARSLSGLLGEKFTAVYGDLEELSKDKAQLISKYKKLLTPDALTKADAIRGRTVFQVACMACHALYGVGGIIGPDLTGSNRGDIDYILLNMLDPSADIPEAYSLVTITTKDGQVLGGTISEEDDQRVVLNMVGQKSTVLKSDIQSRDTSPYSMMPEGLLLTLKDPDVLDLVKYLQTKKQVK